MMKSRLDEALRTGGQPQKQDDDEWRSRRWSRNEPARVSSSKRAASCQRDDAGCRSGSVSSAYLEHCLVGRSPSAEVSRQRGGSRPTVASLLLRVEGGRDGFIAQRVGRLVRDPSARYRRIGLQEMPSRIRSPGSLTGVGSFETVSTKVDDGPLCRPEAISRPSSHSPCHSPGRPRVFRCPDGRACGRSLRRKS